MAPRPVAGVRSQSPRGHALKTRQSAEVIVVIRVGVVGYVVRRGMRGDGWRDQPRRHDAAAAVVTPMVFVVLAALAAHRAPPVCVAVVGRARLHLLGPHLAEGELVHLELHVAQKDNFRPVCMAGRWPLKEPERLGGSMAPPESRSGREPKTSLPRGRAVCESQQRHQSSRGAAAQKRGGGVGDVGLRHQPDPWQHHSP